MLLANYSIFKFIQNMCINHFGLVFFIIEICLASFPIIHHAPLQNCCGPGPEKSLLKAWFYYPAAVFKVQCTKPGIAFTYSNPL